MSQIDVLSASSFEMKVKFGKNIIGRATGFLYEHEECPFLITNYHVASGRHPETNAPLDTKHSAIPDNFEFSIPLRNGASNPCEIRFSTDIQLSLYDSQGNPTWMTHPIHERKVDVVAFYLGGKIWDECLTVKRALEMERETTDFDLKPSMDCFVVGYPQGIAVNKRLPLWKRATIASEPSIDMNDVPLILLDTATREGMSGSPVYARINGYWRPKGSKDDYKIGSARKFIGVYSGRLGDSEFKAQLGMCWKESAILDILHTFSSNTPNAEIKALKT